ncbi:MAG: glycosyltransferase [Candidatus Symbiothrix sp.]|jgi:dolichol-phosphate mannosyltransferase|nr:glycosyltransferase [Candidatus Symbiothrix sp.]
MKKSHLYIVLPAYNEEESIGKLLDRIGYYLLDSGIDDYEVIVVNDGSTDRTEDILQEYAKKMPLRVVLHEKNKGLGQTIRDGLLSAATAADNNDIIITMDADDTHTPGLIYRMVNTMREGYDVVIASRYQRGSRVYGLSLYREFLSIVASYIFRLFLPIKGVKDFTCGYRAYRARVLKDAFVHYGDKFIDQQGFQAMVDIILRLRTMNVIFGEVPFILRYDMKQGTSKMNVKSTILKTLKLILKRKFDKTA